MTMACSFMACSSDDDYEVVVNPVTPETVAAGTYEGEWTRMLLTDSTEATNPGQIIIESDTAYIAKVKFVSESFNLSKEVTANITYANNGFYYFNYSTVNDLKAAFSGKVDAEGRNTIVFTIKQVDGRKIKEFKYSFSGLKTSTSTTE